MIFATSFITHVLKPDFFALKSTVLHLKKQAEDSDICALKAWWLDYLALLWSKYSKCQIEVKFRLFSQKPCQVLFATFLPFSLNSYKHL
jgi:hypothetical protein